VRGLFESACQINLNSCHVPSLNIIREQDPKGGHCGVLYKIFQSSLSSEASVRIIIGS
jgi:hypothetical protein